MAELTQEIDHIYDQAGNILYLKDDVSREAIESLATKDYPVGFRIESKVEIAPHVYFGGKWEYEYSRHGFEGLHIYTRIDGEEE